MKEGNIKQMSCCYTDLVLSSLLVLARHRNPNTNSFRQEQLTTWLKAEPVTHQVDNPYRGNVNTDHTKLAKIL